MLAPNLQVTLVEPQRFYYTCPFSNLVIGGHKDLSELTYGYDNLHKKYGINVIEATAASLNAPKKKVILKDGKSFSYDRAIVSPGVDMRFDKMEGYYLNIVNKIPHAWKAGRSTLLLKKQLSAMPDGGTVLICPPDHPYRCPPGPYERASLIAHYLKQHKPSSKILILDAKEQFAKQALFTSGWEQLYGHMIEWFPRSAGGKILRVDVKGMNVETEFGNEKGDVIPHAETITRTTDTCLRYPLAGSRKAYAPRLENRLRRAPGPLSGKGPRKRPRPRQGGRDRRPTNDVRPRSLGRGLALSSPPNRRGKTPSSTSRSLALG